MLLGRSDRHLRITLGIAACLCVLNGCAQFPQTSLMNSQVKRYRPSTLPHYYAAKPVQDYSELDLTPFAKGTSAVEKLHAGDRIAVQLNSGAWGEEAKQLWNVGIDDAGQAFLPQIGPVQLAGLTQAEAEQSIIHASQSRQVFLTPAVSIELENRSDRTITVMGGVNQPGQLNINRENLTLADVIVRAGGLSKTSTGRIVISGGTVESDAGTNSEEGALASMGHSQINAQTVNLSNTPPSDLAGITVPQGAVVSVEEAPQRGIQVIGVIRNQVVQLPPGKNIHLLDALAMAGGPTYSNWILDRVDVIRQSPDGQSTIRVKCSIRGAKNDSRKNILLSSHDVVSVEENIVTFTLSTVQSLFAVGTSGLRLAGP
ncbi:MAG: polysaccharide biosynthesis/export family protein [Planctomycetaceae bacterium]|nr:polysaccharide biosynthesis/export family protein [Planctomycetaceae bacterium]